MTDISQWVNFIWQKQITRLLFYYLWVFKILKYFIVYVDGFDINWCCKCLFADDSTERKFIFSQVTYNDSTQ